MVQMCNPFRYSGRQPFFTSFRLWLLHFEYVGQTLATGQSATPLLGIRYLIDKQPGRFCRICVSADRKSICAGFQRVLITHVGPLVAGDFKREQKLVPYLGRLHRSAELRSAQHRSHHVVVNPAGYAVDGAEGSAMGARPLCG